MAAPPALGPPLHVHAVEEETICLIEGRLSVTLREQVTQLSGGAIAHVPRGLLHTLANTGPGSARLLIVQSPPGAERYVARAAELIAASHGNPDPAQMHQLALGPPHPLPVTAAVHRHVALQPGRIDCLSGATCNVLPGP